MPVWAWIPITIGAALAQTIRNASQRSLTKQVGAIGATLVRYLYGLPLTAVWLLVMSYVLLGELTIPAFNARYFGWIALSALCQIPHMALMLLAMNERNFVVAVAYVKTEVLQVALFAIFFLQELPGWLSAVAMVIAMTGVFALSMPQIAATGVPGNRWMNKAALYGLGSGAFVALAAVFMRGASFTMPGLSPWLLGGWTVLFVQITLSVLLSGYLALRKPDALKALVRAWRVSALGGGMGALAGIGWAVAVSIRPVSDVRTLGLIEVMFSYFVSRKLFKEALSVRDLFGLSLVTIGLLIVTYNL